MITKEDRNRVIGGVRHALIDFQLGDLEKALAEGLNFLVAIGLMVATEFLGGLVTGELGLQGQSRERFESGFTYLGGEYEDMLTNQKRGVLDIYENVRCGLVHQYLPPNVMGVLAQETFGPGIAPVSDQLLIFVADYVRDLKVAVQKLLSELETNDELLQNCQKGLDRIPHLL